MFGKSDTYLHGVHLHPPYDGTRHYMFAYEAPKLKALYYAKTKRDLAHALVELMIKNGPLNLIYDRLSPASRKGNLDRDELKIPVLLRTQDINALATALRKELTGIKEPAPSATEHLAHVAVVSQYDY